MRSTNFQVTERRGYILKLLLTEMQAGRLEFYRTLASAKPELLQPEFASDRSSWFAEQVSLRF